MHRMTTHITGMAALAVSAGAQAESFGAWVTDATNDGRALYAATVNDSGHLLGQYCYPEDGNCVWLLGISSACEEGADYPVLANSDVASAHVMVSCSARLDSGQYKYVFGDFSAVDSIVKKGSKVGFAVPIQGDRFRVVRFDLRGANAAIEQLRTRAARATDGGGTADEYL